MIKYSFFFYLFIISCSYPDSNVTDLSNITELELKDNIVILLPYGNSCQSCYQNFFNILNSNYFSEETKDNLIIIYSGNDRYEKLRLESMLISNSYTSTELDFKDYVKLKILKNNLSQLEIKIIRIQGNRILEIKNIKAGSTDFVMDQLSSFFAGKY